MRPTGGDCERPDPPRNAQPDSADSSRAPDHYNSSAMMRGLAIAFTALMLCALSSACANQNPLISESPGAQNRVRQQADVHAALAQGDAGAARRHFEQAFNAEGGADDVTLRLNYARFLCEHHEVPAGRALLEYAPRPSPEHAQRIQSLLDVCKA